MTLTRTDRWRLALVGLFVVLFGSVPVLQAWQCWVRGATGPLIHTVLQVPRPAFTLAGAAAFGPALDEHLRELAPTTWLLRGGWHELRYRLDLLQPDAVLIGRDGWFYARPPLDGTPADVDAVFATRRAQLDGLVAAALRADVQLVAVVVPGKERIHPEGAYADGVLPEARARCYERIRAHLDAAGVPSVDLATPLLAARAATPAEPLWPRRDSRWTYAGATVAALTVAAHLQAGFADRLGPVIRYRAPELYSVRAFPDLVSRCGLLEGSVDIGDRRHHFAWSELTRTMFESDRRGTLNLAEADRRLADLWPTAQVALCGTVQSQALFGDALSFCLGRSVDVRPLLAGTDWRQGLAAALAAVEQGWSRARLIVWETTEAMWLDGP